MFPSGVGQSQYKPALAAHAGRLWAVGVVGNHSLWYASGNNTKWDQSTTWVNNEVAQEGPAVAEFAGVLHLVFPDKTSGSLVHLQYNDTTAVWGQRIVLNVTTSGQPALAVFNGSLAMVYYDPSDSNRLHAAAWDPVGWGSFTNLGELTWGTPSLYTVGTATELYLLFPANNNGRTILEISTTAVNGTWGRVTAPNEQSAFGTSAAKFGNTAAMGFQSNNGKGQVLVSFWNGTSWLPHENVASQTSSHTPALAVLDGILNCIFPSHNSNEVVLWAQRPLLAYPLDSWMAHLDGGLYISQLSLPGTHDSAAVTDVPFTETQTMSITEQLAAGIRFFDLRCVLIADTLQMYHGIVSLDTTLNTILQQMYTWFLGSPTRANEGLVVSIKQEGATQDSSMQFDFAVYATVQQSEFWVTNATIPQLQQLRRKIQLVRRYTAVDNTTVGVDFRIGIDASAWGDLVPTPNGALVIEDNYDYDGVVGFASVVANKTAIVEAALAAAMADTVATNWHISFSSASNTPFHPPSSIALGGVSITSPLNPFVVGVNRRLLTYVNPLLLVPAPRAQVGTVLMDFPDSPNGGGLIAAIIELNG
ncbi:PLC-like phosphodiesterase [Mycena crocata]|nr:PLC-like phosphodiesterase [Mycena crocata]